MADPPSAKPPKADINASVYRPCWLLPPIIAIIGCYASRPLLHLSRSAAGELFLLEVVFRPSTNWPTTEASESVSALPPQMDTMLAWSVLSSITRPHTAVRDRGRSAKPFHEQHL